MNSKILIYSKETYGIELIGPIRSDNRCQAKDGAGFSAGDFAVDWESKRPICPAGNPNTSRAPALDRVGKAVITIEFATTD